MTKQKIEVHDGPPQKPGDIVAVALVGGQNSIFEVRLIPAAKGGRAAALYLVDDRPVPRQLYLDALATASADRYCASCAGGEDDEGSDEEEAVVS